MTRFPGSVRAFLFTLLCLQCGAVAAENKYDVIIMNGYVLDGTGNPAYRADVATRNGRITDVRQLPDGLQAERIIDADGLYVSPGFIDLHSHADRGLVSEQIESRRAHNVLSQGITTVVGAPDGRNAEWPVSAEIAAYELSGIGVNVIPMVGHNTVRGQVMGSDYEREATDAEIRLMRRLVREGLEQGAWGLGAGLEYRPGRFSSRTEVVDLAREVAPFDGFYFAHMRSAGVLPKWQLPSMVTDLPTDGQQALLETIDIGRQTGIRVVASHIKAKGRASWGRAAADVLIADRARAQGVQIYFDQYPYDGHSGSPALVIPKWAFAAPGMDIQRGTDDPVYNRPGVLDKPRENLRRVLDDPELRALFDRDLEYAIDYNGGPDRIIVTYHPDASLIGKTVEQIAHDAGRMAADVLIDFALTGDPKLLQGARLRPLSLHPSDVELYMQQEYTLTSTDGQIGYSHGRHPRSYGAFTRKIAKYVRENPVISLPFAIRSATGLPAQVIGLRDRGYIREGQRADVLVFDFDHIQDRATNLDPDRHSEGIRYVLVNGALVIDDTKFTNVLNGEVVLRQSDRT